MKKLMIGMLMCASASAIGAVATVRQIEPGVRPVYNSGTGVMPAGAQETMPKASRQLAKDNRIGLGFTPAMLALVTPVQVPDQDFDVGGLRLNFLYGTCCNFDGLDFGVVGVSQNHANGWLANIVSVAHGDGLGLNTGGVNYFSGDFKGLQIGVINTANKMQGIQIGVVNIISNSDLSFFPIINGYF